MSPSREKKPPVEPTHVYIARVPGCGCIEAFRVDSPDDPKRVGKAVGEMVKQGYQIERVLMSSKPTLSLCKHVAVPKLAQPSLPELPAEGSPDATCS